MASGLRSALGPSTTIDPPKEQPAHQASTPKDGDRDVSAPQQFNIKIFMLFQY